MKRFVLGSVALAAMVAGPAMAADMAVKAPAPAVSYYDWTGVYIGASIGGVWADIDRSYICCAGVPATAPFSVTSRATDTIYDVHAGAQVQWGWLVLGAEVGDSAGFREMRGTVLYPTPGFGFAPGVGTENKITNLLTVGPRVGIAWDRLLVFGTGGYANGKIKAQNCVANVCTPGVFGTQANSSNDGWFAGVGFDYMIYKGVLVDAILGGEYQHFDLSSTRGFTDSVFFPALGGLNTTDLKAKGDIVRARLTIKTHAWTFLN